MSTYNLGAPMSWEIFRGMPDDLKREYILGLPEKYNANGSRIARMMGVNEAAMRNAINELGLGERTHRNMSRAQLEAWEEFVNGGKVKLDPLEVCEPIIPAVSAESPIEAPAPKTNTGCAINSGLLQFTGKAPDIAIALMKFLGDREYRITVEFEEVIAG